MIWNMNDTKVKEKFFMEELDEFFEEKEKRNKRLKMIVRYFLSDMEYDGNEMKIEKKNKKVSKKREIKTIYFVDGKGKSKNTSKLF
jgi:hypothetical protein